MLGSWSLYEEERWWKWGWIQDRRKRSWSIDQVSVFLLPCRWSNILSICQFFASESVDRVRQGSSLAAISDRGEFCILSHHVANYRFENKTWKILSVFSWHNTMLLGDFLRTCLWHIVFSIDFKEWDQLIVLNTPAQLKLTLSSGVWSDYRDMQWSALQKGGRQGRDQYPVLTNIPPQVYNSNEGPYRRKGFKLFLHTISCQKTLLILKAGVVHP